MPILSFETEATESSGRPVVRSAGLRALALLCLLAIVAASVSYGFGADSIVFRHPLDNRPLDVKPRPNETVTPAVKQFHETGMNPYSGDPQAIEAGRALYRRWCQACHLPDGSGRIGPSLIDDEYNYERTNTPVGMFEIIYGGGTGSMQSFRGRLTQDEILKIIAFLESLKK